ENACVSRQLAEICGIDAGYAAVEKSPPLFRGTSQNLQPRRRIGEYADRGQVVMERDALLIDHQDAPAELGRLDADRQCLFHAALEKSGYENVRFPEAHDVDQAWCAKRLRRRQEVHR